MAPNPFRDPSLAGKHRAEREADDARVRAEEEAAERAVREARKKLLRKGGPVVGIGGAIYALFNVVRVLTSTGAAHEEEAAHRAVAAAVAATKPVLVAVDQGGVRPGSGSIANGVGVRALVDRHADELAGCFSDGLGTGALVLGSGPSHAFAYDWTIEPDGSVSNARASRGGATETTAMDRCMLDVISTWSFNAWGGSTQVVAWMFERCPTSRDECVHPSPTPR